MPACTLVDSLNELLGDQACWLGSLGPLAGRLLSAVAVQQFLRQLVQSLQAAGGLSLSLHVRHRCAHEICTFGPV